MISKIVYSYWNHDRSILNYSGFNDFRDMLASYSLSILMSKGHFENIELVTDDFGKKVFIDKLQLPIECNLELNKWSNLEKYWWGFVKIISESIQKEPFLHVDGDAFLIDRPTDDFLNGKLCFQSLEAPFDGWYGWYKPLLERAKNAKSYPEVAKNFKTDYAFNCGVAGGNDLDIFQEWFKAAGEYNLSPNNKEYFKSIEDIIIHQNLLSEQYFIACIAKKRGLELNKDVRFLLDYENLHQEANKVGTRFTHMWGTTKRDPRIIGRVYDRLKSDYPDFYNKVMSF